MSFGNIHLLNLLFLYICRLILFEPIQRNTWLGTHNTLIGDISPAVLVISVEKKEKGVREMISLASANEHTTKK